MCCNAGLMFEGVFEHLGELRLGGNILLMAPMAEQPEAAKSFSPLVWKEADDGARFQMREEPHTNIRALKYLNNFDTHFPKLWRFTHNFPTAPQPEYMSKPHYHLSSWQNLYHLHDSGRTLELRCDRRYDPEHHKEALGYLFSTFLRAAPARMVS